MLDNGLRVMAGYGLMKPDLAQTKLRDYIARCGGQKAASVKFGCSPQFVGQMVHGRRRVPERILTILGLKRQIVPAKQIA